VETRLLREPWGHQVDAINFSLPKTGSMIALGMGAGKSFAAIAVAQKAGAKAILILCPHSVLGVWNGEFRKNVEGYYVEVIRKGTNLKKAEKIFSVYEWGRINDRPIVIVINYESAWRNPTRETLLTLMWDVLIYDESHKIKNNNGMASLFCDRLRLNARKRIGLTGTPSPHSPLDVFAQARALDPRVFGKNYTAFRNRYARMGGQDNTQVVEWLNQDELNKKFHSIAFVRKTSECVDLPPISHHVIPVELSPKARELYESLEENFYAQVSEGEITPKNALVKLLRMQQLTSGIATYDDGSVEQVCTAKIDALREFLECIALEEGPVITFSRFSPDVQNVIKVGEGLEWKTGEVSSRQKDLTEDAKLIPGVRLQSVQIQSGGVGIDFSDASIAAYLLTGFSLGDFDQSVARLHRPGQKNHTRMYHFIAAGTIDVRVRSALKRRRDVIEDILMRRRINEDAVLLGEDGVEDE